MERLGSDCIIQRAIKGSDDFSKINPTSINTIRIMTYILNDQIYHVPLVLRMGRGNTKVDNIHSGGLCIGVKDNGELLENAYQLGYGDNNARYTEHPETGVVFSGYSLKGIDSIIEMAYRVHASIPRLGIISWDFTINDQGHPTLVEANISGQSIWFPQIVHGKGAFEENTVHIIEGIKRK